MTDLVETLAFEPGQQVKCRTCHNEVFKGEVVAFDLNSRILILKSPSSSGNGKNHDLHFLVLDSVSNDFEILEEPRGECNIDLPNIETKYVEAKLAASINERMRLVEAVRNGVSQDGISLYTALSKKYDRASDLTWKDKVKIVVLNSVVISPPYKESDCEPLASNAEAVNYVKKIVHKFWEGYNNCESNKS